MCKFVLHDREGSDSLSVELNKDAEEALLVLLEVNDPLKAARDIFILSNQIGYMSQLIHEASSELKPYWFSSESSDSLLVLTDFYKLFSNMTVKYLEA